MTTTENTVCGERRARVKLGGYFSRRYFFFAQLAICDSQNEAISPTGAMAHDVADRTDWCHHMHVLQA